MANHILQYYIGQKYNRLTVIDQYMKFSENFARNVNLTYFKCQCDCGIVKDILGSHVIGGRIKSCGCLKKEVNKQPYGLAAFNQLYRNYIYTSKRKHLEFKLTWEEFENLTKQNCYYCGIEPERKSICSQNKTFNGEYIYNGIDRKDPKLGYIKENCVPCCWYCNEKKSNDSYEDWNNWLDRIVKFRGNK